MKEHKECQFLCVKSGFCEGIQQTNGRTQKIMADGKHIRNLNMLSKTKASRRVSGHIGVTFARSRQMSLEAAD